MEVAGLEQGQPQMSPAPLSSMLASASILLKMTLSSL